MSAHSEQAKRASAGDPAVFCNGKHPFDSRQIAQQVAERSNRRKGQGKRMSAYRCGHCSAWHVGSDKAGNRSHRRHLRQLEKDLANDEQL